MLIIKEEDLNTLYPLIGYGDEGYVYNYNNEYAIKIFTYCKRKENYNKLKRKIAKLKDMLNEHDPNCAFPLGFVSFDGTSIDGYYTQLVKHRRQIKDIEDIELLRDPAKEIEYLVKADEVLQRLHQKQFIVGDVKQDNILIDRQGNTIYIDTDNYKYKYHTFDLVPDRAGLFYNLYGGTVASKDNDILVFTIMSLYLLTGNEKFSTYTHQKEIFTEALREIRLHPEERKELEYIFSQGRDKPYLGPILQKVNPNVFRKNT